MWQKQFTGLKGCTGSIEDTIRGFNMPLWTVKWMNILKPLLTWWDTMDDAIEKGKKMLEQAQG
jgi:hypothetical protein